MLSVFRSLSLLGASLRPKAFLYPLICLLAFGPSFLQAESGLLPIGVAKVDITPDYAVRLSGYGNRTTESEGVDQKIWAKALAIGDDESGVSIFITVDNTGVPSSVTEAVFQALAKETSLTRGNFVVASSHSHTTPMLTGVLAFLFSSDIPPEHQERIDQYTQELIENMRKVSLAALADRNPASLAWGQGKVGFAKNRREANGPVDQSLPILAVHSPDGKLRAVLANYACHCTTLTHNKIHGDWAGDAQELIEAEHPGAIAMISIGTGADANPAPRGNLALARQHGQDLADEVSRLLQEPLTRLTEAPAGSREPIELAFGTLPTRDEWIAKSKEEGIIGYHAKKNLERLDRGKTLPTTLPYTVQEWHFGDDLTMVFLPGEVVSDYALRLKKEFSRLWVTAYANDVPCYIPSERVLALADSTYRYEGSLSMNYYDRPTRFATGVEERIINAVHEIVPSSFLASYATDKPASGSPEESLQLIHKPEEFVIELVAAEPLIVDPVAIDFGPDGKLWVVEMHDYPMGIDGNWKPGGRVKFLTDTNGDGVYDKESIFVDDLPFPTGVLAYRKGVLICAAPNILYAEDTTGDGRADLIEKLFTGFATENYQARVNGLSYGLDNWIYGANGLLGGTISGKFSGKDIDIRGRDFRMRPETGEFEAVAGLTQQGRVRDDFGNWIGSDNSNAGWHYPLPERYLKRNPHIAGPGQRVLVSAEADPRRVYPTSQTLERFNQPGHANRLTSACGEGIYRDNLLGSEMYGDYFIAETVHNLVHRLRLDPKGATFAGHRVAGEQTSEFFSSSDNWSRPVQIRTGPDGALWVVDMVRAVIEHPKWISPEQLAKLDVRAGDDKGRIYRIYPKGKKLRSVPDFTKMIPAELAVALDTPNGTQRDLIQRQLVERQDTSVTEALTELARNSDWPATRVQALATLDGLGTLRAESLIHALSDSHPGVRGYSVVLSEPFLSKSEKLATQVLALAEDPDFKVRYQVALSLGEWADPQIGPVLGKLALSEMSDPWFRTAILSSSSAFPGEIFKAVLSSAPGTAGREEMVTGLIATIVALDDTETLAQAVSAVTAAGSGKAQVWQLTALASLMEALDRANLQIGDLLRSEESKAGLAELIALARKLTPDDAAPAENRAAGLRLLGAQKSLSSSDLKTVIALIDSPTPELALAALDALRRQSSPRVANLLLSDWEKRSPAVRTRLIDLLLSRDAWALTLIEAIEKGQVSGAEVSAPNQERLFASGNQDLRRRAEAALHKFRPQDRTKVIAEYEHIDELTGRVPYGAHVFRNTCAACHSFRGIGQSFGPDVGLFREKNVADYLEAILDPNAVIEPRFINYLVETKDGRRLAGVIAEETANSLILVQLGGARETLLRSEITRIEASKRSMMPDGLEASVSPQQMADLIKFLRSTEPKRFGSATDESAKAAREELQANNLNGLAKVEAAAEQLNYRSWLGTLPMALCRQTSAKSTLTWQTDPVPANLPADQMFAFLLPAGMGNHIKPGEGFDLKVNGQTKLRFDVAIDDRVWESKDGQVRMSYEVRERNVSDGSGPLTIEVAPALLTPGKPVTFSVVGADANSARWFAIYLLSEEQQLEDTRAPVIQILDDAKPHSVRDSLIEEHAEKSAEILKEMIVGIDEKPGEEYRRIPWIWKVTIAAGRRNQEKELRQILEISTPATDAPLTHWQAVVLGGGVINGITQAGDWPKPVIDRILSTDAALQKRWNRALELSAEMANDATVPAGTRYDALRMIALQPWETSGEQLRRYLTDANHQLQQGAVSGLGDMEAPAATTALIENLDALTDSNRQFALEALLRTPERKKALKSAIENGKVSRKTIGEDWIRENLE